MGKNQSKTNQEIKSTKQSADSSYKIDQQEQTDIVIKIIFLGDQKVGKTAIFQRMCGKGFDQKYNKTIGVEYNKLDMNFSDVLWRSRRNKLFYTANTQNRLWDTVGDPRFKIIVMNFLKGSDGIIFVYDVGKPETLTSIEKQWLPYIHKDDPKPQMLLLGNKIDQKIDVDLSEVQQIADKYGMISSTVSAKTGQNIESTTTKLIKRIVESKVDVIMKKDMYMHMLLHINEDFDDDLLQDTMGILVDL